jgi:site-specific DNA-methyltransferase (adenine-specific)
MTTLINQDCLLALPTIADASIDFILTDLPYGVTANHWDSQIDLPSLWTQYWRILKPSGAIALFGMQPFSSTLIASQPKHYGYSWTWDKVNKATNFLNAKKQPLRITEEILMFYRSQPTYNPQMTEGKPYTYNTGNSSTNYAIKPRYKVTSNGERYPTNLIKIKGNRSSQEIKPVHPTEKPVSLCEYLIKTYTNENEHVLDSCMGSGTTGIAALNLNRYFTGIELNATYFQLAKDRINEILNTQSKIQPIQS